MAIRKNDRRIDATMNLDKSFENLEAMREFSCTQNYKETYG